MSRKPVIGLVLDEQMYPTRGVDFSNRPYYALRKDYIDVVRRIDATPVLIPYVHEDINAYLDLCDGLIATGADHRFNKSWYSNPEDVPGLERRSDRREFEDKLILAALKRDVPFLGICNGMQVMAAVLGARIRYGNDPGPNNPGGRIHASTQDGVAYHDVFLTAGSRVHDIYGADRIETNSAHTEAVVEPTDRFRVTGKSDDGIIEAIELPDARFAIGLQWHPELGRTPDSVDPVFHAFRKVCVADHNGVY